MIAVSPGEWMKRGRCYVLKLDPDIFFEDGTEALAKSHCLRCPVRQTCLDWAMETKPAGVWGGMTDDERRKIARVTPRVTCLGCLGTRIYSDGRDEMCLGCGLSWRATA